MKLLTNRIRNAILQNRRDYCMKIVKLNSKKLQEILDERGMTAEELGKLIKTKKPFGRFCDDDFDCEIELLQLVKIAMALEIDVKELLL